MYRADPYTFGVQLLEIPTQIVLCCQVRIASSFAPDAFTEGPATDMFTSWFGRRPNLRSIVMTARISNFDNYMSSRGLSSILGEKFLDFHANPLIAHAISTGTGSRCERGVVSKRIGDEIRVRHDGECGG